MSNTVFALWIGFSAALVLLFFCAAWVNIRRRQTRHVDLEQLIPDFLPVDIEAFSGLLESVPAYGGEQRERISSMAKCLRRMSHNAALLQQLGYVHINSSNQLISELAQQMVDAGVQVRLYTLIGLVVLQCWRLSGLRSLPGFLAARITQAQQMMAHDLLPSYELLKDKAGNLTCLKFSAQHDALLESL